jgi:hypothetical protein
MTLDRKRPGSQIWLRPQRVFNGSKQLLPPRRRFFQGQASPMSRLRPGSRRGPRPPSTIRRCFRLLAGLFSKGRLPRALAPGRSPARGSPRRGHLGAALGAQPARGSLPPSADRPQRLFNRSKQLSPARGPLFQAPLSARVRGQR